MALNKGSEKLNGKRIIIFENIHLSTPGKVLGKAPADAQESDERQGCALQPHGHVLHGLFTSAQTPEVVLATGRLP